MRASIIEFITEPICILAFLGILIWISILIRWIKEREG